MASDDHWNLQALSPESREAAQEAARRRGVPFEQWVQSAILESAQEGKSVQETKSAQEGRNRTAQAENRAAERWRSSEPDRDRGQDAMSAVRTLSESMDDLRDQLDRLTRDNSNTVMPGAQMESEGRDLATALRKIDEHLAGTPSDDRADQRTASNTLSKAPDEWPGSAVPTGKNELDRRIAAVDHALGSLNSGTAKASATPAAQPKARDALDHAVEDIRKRQRILDVAENADSLQRQFVGLSERLTAGTPRATTTPTPASSADVKEQLRQISEELHSWRHSDGLHETLLALREELSEIASKLNRAAPRRALEALESEVRALVTRLDDNRSQGTDAHALASIEQGLAEVRASLSKYAPAEALATFHDEVKALDRKLESIGANADNGGLKQLQQSVADLREVASHAASGDALIALADEVQRIADKLDHLTSTAHGSDLMSNLDRRFEALAAELGARAEQGQGAHAATADNLVTIVESLAGRMEQLELGHDSTAALDAISEQIKRLTDRVGATDARLDHLEQMDRSFSEMLDRVESLRADSISAAERAAHGVATEALRDVSGFDGSALRTDLDTLRESHSRGERHTQDTLEVVHDTLERLIDRLAAVETDLRAPLAPSAPAMASAMANEPIRAPLVAPPRPMADTSEESTPEPARRAPPVLGPAHPLPERRPIDPSLPADHPLEPGAVRPGRPMVSAAERIAASEAALGPAKPAPEPDARSNFIAAARRAAQAAANMAPASELDAAAKPDTPAAPSLLRRLTGRRSLMLGGVALLVATGGLVLALNGHDLATRALHAWLQARPNTSTASVPAKARVARYMPPAAPTVRQIEPADDRSADDNLDDDSPESTPAPAAQPDMASASRAAAPTSATPAQDPRVAASVSPFTIASMQQPATGDVTGSISRATGLTPQPGANVGAMPLSIVPPAAGQPGNVIPAGLQSAASNGNAAAAYEVASRYAEGRGVAPDMQAAAHWFENAADKGLTPAQYRLGSLYEKGQGVKKDLNLARRFYSAAADKGHGKAMHNLAVLYSEGIDGKPDFTMAAQWFLKAASHGVADSQYNLGILYARGLGVDQSLTESYKWFALAAQQGDPDAGNKRDEIAGRLNPQDLATAQQAVKSFAVEAQPDAAVNVKAPPGGWDSLVPTAAISQPKAPHSARRKIGSL